MSRACCDVRRPQGVPGRHALTATSKAPITAERIAGCIARSSASLETSCAKPSMSIVERPPNFDARRRASDSSSRSVYEVSCACASKPSRRSATCSAAASSPCSSRLCLRRAMMYTRRISSPCAHRYADRLYAISASCRVSPRPRMYGCIANFVSRTVVSQRMKLVSFSKFTQITFASARSAVSPDAQFSLSPVIRK